MIAYENISMKNTIQKDSKLMKQQETNRCMRSSKYCNSPGITPTPHPTKIKNLMMLNHSPDFTDVRLSRPLPLEQAIVPRYSHTPRMNSSAFNVYKSPSHKGLDFYDESFYSISPPSAYQNQIAMLRHQNRQLNAKLREIQEKTKQNQKIIAMYDKKHSNKIIRASFHRKNTQPNSNQKLQKSNIKLKIISVYNLNINDKQKTNQKQNEQITMKRRQVRSLSKIKQESMRKLDFQKYYFELLNALHLPYDLKFIRDWDQFFHGIILQANSISIEQKRLKQIERTVKQTEKNLNLNITQLQQQCTRLNKKEQQLTQLLNEVNQCMIRQTLSLNFSKKNIQYGFR